jgi:hypothetical protein
LASLLPLSTLDFGCVLPVYRPTGASTGAFISFPAGTLAPANESGYYYDRAVSRWVPVYREAISPDGRLYAYTEGGPFAVAHLHIVDASTGHDIRVVTMPDAPPSLPPTYVADFTSTGIYVVPAYEGIWPGVWHVDPATGAVAKVSNGYYQPAGAAWITVVDSRDPNPTRSAMDGQPQPNRIDRRDSAGATVTWFYKPGYALHGLPFAGSPSLFVWASRQDIPNGTDAYELWLVAAPGKQLKLAGWVGISPATSPYVDFLSRTYSAIADVHGIWIGGDHGLYLVKPTGQILRVYGESVYPANGCS